MKEDDRLVVGTHPIEELLTSAPQSLKTLYLAPEPRRDALKAIAERARKAGISVVSESMQQLDKRSGGVRHQGAIAVTAAFPYADFDEELKKLASLDCATVVLLDSVQDPHNTGAIIRSAVAFSVDLVVVPKDRAAPVTPQVERAAAGTTARIAISRVTNLKRAIEALKEQGFWIVGAGTRDGVQLDAFEFANKTGLVIGAEGDGMRAGIEAAVDHVVTIPISQRAESLNASNAAAVILYERARKKR
jgi:23S rRNA (guanosine2251-2'-O)-methyltransferase